MLALINSRNKQKARAGLDLNAFPGPEPDRFKISGAGLRASTVLGVKALETRGGVPASLDPRTANAVAEMFCQATALEID